MIYSLRFYVSWILAAVVMYVAFYFWHGVFLNDLNRINFSKILFLFLAALVYLVVSFVLYKTFEASFFHKYIAHPLVRGAVSGFIIGFVLFSIVAVLGISFTKHVNATYLLADFAWQIAEQVLGGIIIGFGKLFIFERMPDRVNIKG